MRNYPVRLLGLLTLMLSVLVYIPHIQAAPPGLSVPYTQNFDSLSSTGSLITWTDDSNIAGWYAERNASQMLDYTASNGATGTGAFYSFGENGSTERAMGSIASPSIGNIRYAVRLVNDTGTTLTGLNISYTGEQWRRAANASQHKLDFSYTFDTVNIWEAVWTNVDALDFTGPLASLATAEALNGNTNSVTISGNVNVNIPAGATITLGWLDVNDGGSAPDHGLAIDNLTVSAIGVNTATPTLATATPQNTATSTDTATADVTATATDAATATATTAASTSTPTATTDPSTATSTPTATGEPTCGSAPDKIPELQEGGGKWNNSNNASVPRTVVGIVTGDFQTGLSGFYMQDETGDGNPVTSDGIYVTNLPSVDVVVGQRILVTGTTREQNGQTQFTPSLITNCGTIAPIAPTIVTLPIQSTALWERYEGMLIKVNGPLTVTETFNLTRFGEIWVSSRGRLFQPTNYVAPGDAALAEQQLNDRSRLLVDDGRNGTPTNGQVPYIANTESVFRQGFTTADITGVLGFGFGDYRLQPTHTIAWNPANPRPAAPMMGSRLRVASFNLLNYFNTFMGCYGTDTDNCRGADTEVEFNRQRTKTTAAIVGMDADIIVVNELENDLTNGSSAVEQLVTDLNPTGTANPYSFINTGQIGTDAIRVGILYNTTTVRPVGSFATLSAAPFDQYRPPLAQLFEEISTGEKFYVIANHFKSKNCEGAAGADTDQNDGQSCYNATRVQMSTALLAWLDADPYFDTDPDVLIMGDLNAYAKEDPITTLKTGGFTDLIETYVGGGQVAYSYTFRGQSGYLDHALANASFASQIVDADEWHINADEPAGRDYNTEEDRQSYLYQPNAFRSSDHDPVIVGVFAPAQPTTATPEPTGTTASTATNTPESTTSPVPTATTSAATELLPNGSFEANGQAELAPWKVKRGGKDSVKCNKDTDNDGAADDKVFAHEGSCAFQFKGSRGENAKLQQNIAITAVTFSPGDTLTLSGYFRAPKASAKGKIKLRVRYSDGSDTGKLDIEFVQAAVYQPFRQIYTLTSGSVEKIKLQIDHKSRNGKVLIDGISLQLDQSTSTFIPLP